MLSAVVVSAVPSDFALGEAVCIPVGSSAVDSADRCVVTPVGLPSSQEVNVSNVAVPSMFHVVVAIDVSGGTSV